MQPDSKNRVPLRTDTLAAYIEQKLDREVAVLDLIVGAEIKGQNDPAIWKMLHEAARRDGRQTELAAAYERLAKDKKIKTLTAASQAEVFANAGAFFAEVIGDAGRAADLLEKALTAVPGHVVAFERLERILVERQELARLADLYAAAAPARSDKKEQLSLLRRAIDIATAAGDEDRVVKLYQQILKSEPGDSESRRALDERFTRAGRFADLAKMLEQALAALASVASAEEEALTIRCKLIRLYTNELKEAERALGHVEEVLRVDPALEPAFEVAEQLLGNKAVAARAASALAGVYDRMGDAGEAARMMAIEVEHLRGPKRIEAQKRLATLILQKIGDIHGAFAHFEAIVTIEPSDEEFRLRYRELSAVLDKRVDATRVLTRAIMASKEPALKARINAELGELFIEIGDTKKARAAFQGVLDGGGDDGATLRATRAMAKLAADARDTKGLAVLLEKLADAETETEARAAAADRLAKLYEGELNDPKAAIGAYKRLFDTPLEREALQALERLLEGNTNDQELADVLERRAALEAASKPEAARGLAFRAAELRTAKLSDRAAALDAWRRYIAGYGPSREAHARMFPLLEQEKRWEELAQRLMREAELSAVSERPAVLARIGQIRLARLADERGALEAYRDALAIDPTEKTSRGALEKALAAGPQQLFAASVLEPIARSEGAAPLRVRLLEVRGSLSAMAEERLSALAEAARVAETELGDTKRALDIAGRALRSAIEGSTAPEGGALDQPSSDPVPPEEINRWIERVERLGASDAAARAEVLEKALGDRAITSPLLADLAQRAGDALTMSGEAARALAILKRALAFSPSSPELLAKVDALLKDQGSPDERVGLYVAALERTEDAASRGKLLHAIGAIELREKKDAAAAIAIYRRAVANDPEDRAAFLALSEAHAAAGPSREFYEDLEQGLPRLSGPDLDAARIRMADVALALGLTDKAAEQFAAMLAEGVTVPVPALETIEKLARERDDVPLLYALIERRVATATEPREEAHWLERLGELAARRSDPAAAVAAWKQAAQIAERAAAFAEEDAEEAAWAARLYERVLTLATDDAEAIERLVELYRAQGAWERLPAVHAARIRAAKEEGEAVRRLLAFEEAAVRARASGAFAEACARVAEQHAPLSPPLAAASQAALARVFAADPERKDEASAAYRGLLERAEGDVKANTSAFEAFLAGTDRHDDRRWLFGYKLERASEGDRIPILFAWASDEERVMGDAKAAAELYGRALAIDPGHEGALEARARLLLESGDAAGAVSLIAARRDLASGAARATLDRQLASLFIDRLSRFEEGLTAIEPVLEQNPGDEPALGIVGRAMAEPDTRARAAGLLQKACDAVQEPEVRAKILDLLLSTPADAPELRSFRRGWFERLLAPLSDNPHRALEVALRAVAERPQEAALWDQVEQLGRETNRPELVAEAYKKEIQRKHDAPIEPLELETVEELGRRAVEYHEQWRDDPAEIAALLRRIVELVPESSWAFERLKLAYNAAEQWSELFGLYDRAIERAGDDALTRGEILEEAVEAAKNLANDTEQTMIYLEQLLPIRKDARTRAALERLYEKHARYRPLIDLYAAQLSGLDQEAAQRMRARIAGLWLDGVGDAEAAFEATVAMLQIEPGRAEAIALLEKLLSVTASASASASALAASPARQKAAALLEERYQAEGRPEDLVRVLDVVLESCSNVEERARRLREIFLLRRDSMKDAAGALSAIAALVEVEPAVKEHRDELERLARELGRFDRLAEALAAASTRAEDRALKRSLLEGAAAIHRDHLGDLGKAIEQTREVLGLSAGDTEAVLATLRELDALLTRAGRAAERCDVLERLASAEPNTKSRRDALGELARIAWSELGDADRAISAYKARLADDEADIEALDGMIAALEQTARFPELTDTLGRRAAAKAAKGDAAEAKADLVRAARILDDKIGDPDAAILAWAGVREKFGPDAVSGDALAELLERQACWPELVELYESEVATAGSGEREGDLWRRLGDVHRDRTLALDRSITSYSMGIKAESEAARVGLEELLERLDRGSIEQHPLLVAAVDVLCAAYGAAGDVKRTIGLLEPRLAAAESDVRRVAVLEETAKLLESKEGDAAGAFDAIWRALLLIPSAPLASEALRLARAADRLKDVADALGAGFEARGDVPPEVLRDLFWHVGVWHRDTRLDPDAAEAAIMRALVHDGESVEILSALAELLRRAPGRPLVTVLLKLADLSPPPANLLDLLGEAVVTALDPVGDRELAKATATRLFDAAMKLWSPADGGELPEAAQRASSPMGSQATPNPSALCALGALDTLVRLAREEGDRASVLALSQKGAELPFGKDTRKRLLIQAAEAADPEAAIDIYKGIFDEEPTDARVSGELEALYRKLGKGPELLALRKRQVEVADVTEARVALRLDLALLLADAGDLDASIAALRESLLEDPSHVASVAKLGELLSTRGLDAELCALWESQAARLEGAGDSAGAADLFAKAAAIAEQKLGDTARAIAGHRRASSLGGLGSQGALARLLMDRGDHAAAADVLEAIADRASPEVAHADILRLVDARVAAGQPSAARERLERAIPVVKTPAPLRERLAVLYREAEEWGPLADLIVAEAARVEGRSARLARLREAAELHLVRRKDPAAAIPLLEQAAELVPEDMAARLTLCQAYVAAGRLDDAAAILRGLIASYGGRRPKERALVHYELARVLIKAGERAQALEELDAALRIDPAHPDILHALATLAFEMDQLDRANRAYRALLLVVRRARDRDDQSTGVMRAEVLFALSEIAERQNEPERAAEYFDSAFEASRESAEERERLVSALRARGRHGMLARALEARLATAASTAQAVGILQELAAVYEDNLGRPEDALDAWLRAIGLDPASPQAHAAARGLAIAVGQVPKYIAAVSKLIEDTTDEARVLELLLHLGRAFGGDPSHDAQAAPVYERAERLLAARPEHAGNVEAWRALDAIYGRKDDREAQAVVLEKLIAATSDGESLLTASQKADPLYRLAALRFADPASQARGAELLERALALDPQPDRVEEALREAVRVAPKSEHALRLLERFARESGRPRSLAEAILLLSAIGKASAEGLREAIDIGLAAGDKALAEACLRVLLALPKDDIAPPELKRSLVELGEIREAAGDLAEAADLLERAAAIAPAEQARALSLHVASLAAGPLEDLARASRLYESLAASDPGARVIWEPLADVYRRLGDEASLAALIERTAPLVDSPTEQSMLRTERARIVMKSDPARAIDLFREILVDDPTQSEASALLADLLEKAGRVDELIEILTKKIETAKDREDSVTVLGLSMKLGSLLEQRDDESGALDLYHGVLDWDAHNLPALRAIVRLGLKREDSIDLGNALDKLLLVEQGDEAVELALHLAALRSMHGDAIGAEQALEAGHAACPKHDRLRARLIESYTAREKWQKLADLYTSDAETRENKAERVECLCRAAEILRERAHDVAGAAQVLERALGLDPSDRDVLLALIDAYDALGEHGRAAQAISVAVQSTPDDPWLYRSRALHREALGLHDEALADIERAYEMTAGAYAGELVELLERAVGRAAEDVSSAGDDWESPPTTESPQRGIRLRLVEVLLKTGEAERARAHLNEILRLDAKDRQALRLLASVEEVAGRWDDAGAVFGRLLAVEEGDALVDTALKLADMCDRAGLLDNARPGLERALAAVPGNAALRDRLRSIYTSAGATRELAGFLLEDAAGAQDAAGRFGFLIQAGRLLLGSPEDALRAAQVFEDARGLRPDDQETVLLLAEAKAASGDIAAARAVLGQVIAASKGRRTKQLAIVYQRLSRIEAAEGNLSESLTALSKAFEMDPGNGSLAMELGLQAVDLCEFEIASRAFRSVTLMKAAPAGSLEGISPASRALAYYHLGDIAKSQGDLRKARLMVEKAVSEDPSLEPARSLLEELRGG